MYAGRNATETPPVSVSLNNIVINSVVSYNYLGVVLNNELSLTRQMSVLHAHVQRKLFHLRKIRKFLTEFASVQVYKQTILPLLDYCGFLSMSANKNELNSLQILQNDALRVCVGYPLGYNMSHEALHSRVKLSSIFQRWNPSCMMSQEGKTTLLNLYVQPDNL